MLLDGDANAVLHMHDVDADDDDDAWCMMVSRHPISEQSWILYTLRRQCQSLTKKTE